MKKTLRTLLAVVLCLLVISPLAVSAASFSINGTDMSIQIDDSQWYVFTRENIENNPELADLGLTYEDMYSHFYDNDIYLDGTLFISDEDYIEMNIEMQKAPDGIAHLSTLSEGDIEDFAEGVAKGLKIDECTLHKTSYTFVRAEYIDDEGTSVCRFMTIVNGNSYFFNFLSDTGFDSSLYSEIESIIGTVRFDVDTTMKNTIDSDSDSTGVIASVIGAGVAGGIGGWLRSRKKKKAEKNEDPPANSPEF